MTTALGRCIRFSVDEVRVFAGRDSTGVRGVRLAESDKVMSMAILDQVAATPDERRAYMKRATALRRAMGQAVEGEEAPVAEEPDEDGAEAELSGERIAQLEAAEQFILTADSEGFGKRTSAYDYRRTGRGGQGLTAHDMSRGGHLVAAFPVGQGDEIMMVSDQGQIIRAPVDNIRIAGRNTRGVILFRTAENEHVVSVEHIQSTGEDDGESGEVEPDDIEAGEIEAGEDESGGDEAAEGPAED